MNLFGEYTRDTSRVGVEIRSQRTGKILTIGKPLGRFVIVLLLGCGALALNAAQAAVGGTCTVPIANAASITRFLTQATFGPTKQDICDLSQLIAQEGHELAGIAAWIDAQLSMPATLLPDEFDPTRGNNAHRLARNYAWFERALNAPD